MKTLPEFFKSVVGKYTGRQKPLSDDDVRAIFARFQKVLEDNGRALQIITDLGEKVSGSYLFDITFIERAYTDLAAGMKVSLADFRALTAGHYPELDQAFKRIDSRISDLISGAAGPEDRLAIDLKQLKPDDAREAGGKCFHVAELGSSLGLLVPEGFVLTVHAYEEFLKHNGLVDIIASLADETPDADRLGDIRRLILSGSLPASLSEALGGHLENLRRRSGEGSLLAVRSSAEEEDDVFSFAGQFETVLGVPAETGPAGEAYKRVLASLFSEDSAAYQQSLRYTPGGLRMAVGFMEMVDANASGVVYSSDPRGNGDGMIISADWGLGKSVVEGDADADRYVVRKTEPFEITETRAGKKETMYVTAASGGVISRETPATLRQSVTLEPDTVREIARQAAAIEEFYGRPQDIEWAADAKGEVFILQSRPLRMEQPRTAATADTPAGEKTVAERAAAGHRVLFRDTGYVVQPGAVGGRVFLAASPDDLKDFPRGAVLVARNDSPQFARVMPYASAIITDSGNPTSHMASISRELRVPTVVGAGIATGTLEPGDEITLVADDEGNMTVYEGLVRDLIDEQHRSFLKLEELYEFRRKKYIMQFIAPLNLVNPLTDDFRPDNCQTMHDILRFIHEMSIQELIGAARNTRGTASLKRLRLSVPQEIRVIDLGGGLAPGAGDPMREDQVTSTPFKAVLKGMTYPEIWSTEAGTVNFADFLSGMVRTGDLAKTGSGPTLSMAVISGQYMNLSLRLGYHFNLVDSYCGDLAASNHVYFRFFGGGAGITKRLRRVTLIETVLRQLGFISRVQGDLIEARISNIPREEVERILDQLGRLIAFTRQLDTALARDSSVEEFAERFIREDYVA